ncbi:hypothetical protein P691DRAFT_805667 [Macrolepiota fuliginosa MF-IS2]|uniref:Uncharacterized protein n=1 Tax=Macrolepiota fuliginosa MF-IS2 TaxID=1400762 RepID=A0A9P6BZI8_9AGAR|nr:hypothetical protein P691DRAFT_805667 [Macrolepiota fuliginosa MF-IS2]
MGDNITARLKNILKKSETPQATSIDPVVADTPTVEPTSLALRIQSLIDSLPTPTRKTTVRDTPLPRRDENGRPIPPATAVKDSKLIQILSSATIMNGSRDRDRSRPSIWGILEGLGTSKHKHDLPGNGPQSDPGQGHDDATDAFSDSSSIMVYSPLLPTRDSFVELAESEVFEEEEAEELVPVIPPPLPGWTWSEVLPSVTSWFTQPPPSPLLDDSGQPLTPRSRERRLRAQAARVWIPSKTQLSIQCMWWGYRMFLPPSALDILDDKHLEAAKRAAMITTALTWFFNNLPINSLPIALHPPLLLLQHIAPYLGYIGTFMSWSWSTIKSYDQGFGVILTATWLLPIALVPGTWFERDWPASPHPPGSTPLPPEPSSSPLPSNTPASLPPTLHSPSMTPLVPTPISTLVAELPALPTPNPPSSPQIHSSYALPLSASSPSASSPSAPTSPALTFVTAPSSPGPSSPKRMHMNLASLVAKSPIIHIRKSKSNSSSPPIQAQLPPTSSPQPLVDAVPYPSPPSTNMTTPITASAYTPGPLPPSLLPYSSANEMQPSPPAHPDDLRLLQSPIWETSPLPPEHVHHPVLPSNPEDSQEKKRRKGMRFLKGRKS